MNPPVVRDATPDERARVVSIQVMAFGSDPIMRWLYPEADAYLRHFPGFADAFGGNAFEHDTAFVAEDFGGAAMWLPPGAHPDDAAIEASLEGSVSGTVRDEVFAMLGEMERCHIDEPHWYLPVIGVDPKAQGRGIGSALLQYALARCDEAGLPAWLESSNPANVPLYERHGFRVVETIQIGGSPPVFPMLRERR